MNKNFTRLALLTLAALTMSIAMPSCPGQQAMQEQIDQLTKKEAEMAKRMAALEGKVQNMASDVSQAKQAIIPLGPALEQLVPKLTQMEEAIKVLQNPPKPVPAPKGKPAPKKR